MGELFVAFFKKNMKINIFRSGKEIKKQSKYQIKQC